MVVLPLKGTKSLAALRVTSHLLMGYKMLPALLGTSYQVFHESFKEMPEFEKETIIRQAVAFVEVSPEDVEAMASFCTDANGIPYSKANIKNLGPDELMEIVVAVAMEISRIKINLVSEEEKKKYQTDQLTCASISSSIPNSH